MKKPKKPTDPQTWIDILDDSLLAYGRSLELGDKHPVCEALYAAHELVENMCCREHREVYRQWAADQEISEPCDAWFEGNLKASAYRWWHDWEV